MLFLLLCRWCEDFYSEQNISVRGDYPRKRCASRRCMHVVFIRLRSGRPPMLELRSSVFILYICWKYQNTSNTDFLSHVECLRDHPWKRGARALPTKLPSCSMQKPPAKVCNGFAANNHIPEAGCGGLFHNVSRIRAFLSEILAANEWHFFLLRRHRHYTFVFITLLRM